MDIKKFSSIIKTEESETIKKKLVFYFYLKKKNNLLFYISLKPIILILLFIRVTFSRVENKIKKFKSLKRF